MNSEQEQLAKAFSDQPVDLYGASELRAQLETTLANNPPDAAPVAPDLLADAASQAGAEILGTSWEVAREAQRAIARLFNEILPDSDLMAPELSDFVKAGVEFSRLQESFEAMEVAGFKPELILAPIDLTLESWKTIYASLRQWQDQNHPNSDFKLKSQSDGDGLYVYSGVANAWDDLARHAAEATPGARVEGPLGITWKALVVPTASKAEGGLIVNTSHDLNEGRDKLRLQIGGEAQTITPEAAHMPIGAYLTLQAEHVYRDEPLLDSDTWTWNAGTFDSGSRAPASYWRSGNGQVDVNYDLVGSSDDRIGARLPVWG